MFRLSQWAKDQLGVVLQKVCGDGSQVDLTVQPLWNERKTIEAHAGGKTVVVMVMPKKLNQTAIDYRLTAIRHYLDHNLDPQIKKTSEPVNKFRVSISQAEGLHTVTKRKYHLTEALASCTAREFSRIGWVYWCLVERWENGYWLPVVNFRAGKVWEGVKNV